VVGTRFREKTNFMKHLLTIALLGLALIGLASCYRKHDRVRDDGSKVFGEYTWNGPSGLSQ